MLSKKKTLGLLAAAALVGAGFYTANMTLPDPDHLPESTEIAPQTETDGANAATLQTTSSAGSGAQATATAPSEALAEPVVYGTAEAPVKIEEYASFTCSHCAHFYEDTLPQLKERYLDAGTAQLSMYSFIRNEQDLRASMLVLCQKDNEQRQRYVKALFEAQDQWAYEADFVGSLRMIAQMGGMSAADFESCMNDKELEDKLLESRQDYTSRLNISSTPTFFIGGKEIKGADRIEVYQEAIEAQLSAAKSE